MPLTCELVSSSSLETFSSSENVLVELRSSYDSYFHSPQWQLWIDDRIKYKSCARSLAIEDEMKGRFPLIDIEDPGRDP